ncbi:hypothetical protein, partial [Streptomyces cyaneofuscatus]
QVAELEARERELTVPSAVLSILKPGVDVYTSWQQAPINARRAAIRLLLSPRYLGAPHILAASNPGRYQQFVERIEWRRTEIGPGVTAADGR